MQRSFRLTLWLLFLWMFIQQQSHAQEDLGLLVGKLEKITEDTGRVFLLNRIAMAFADTNYDRSLHYAREALNLANKINYKPGIADANKVLADVFLKAGNIQPAVNYYLISIKVFSELDSLSMIASIYNQLAKSYEMQGNDRQALENYNKALKFADQSENRYEKAFALNYIGGVHYREENYKQAFDYFLQSLMIREEIRDSSGMAASYNNVGEIYFLRDEYDKALEHYTKSVVLNKKLDKPQWLAINYENIGRVFQAINQPGKALEYYKTSLKINREINNITGIVTSLSSLGSYYNKAANHLTALRFYDSAFSMADRHKLAAQKSNAALGLSETYAGLGQFRNALDYYKLHATINDSIFNIQKVKQIAELEARYEAERSEQQLLLKEKENKLLERNVKIIGLRYIMILGGLLLLIIIAILMYGRQRIKIKRDREMMVKDREIHKTQRKLMESELRIKNNDLMNFALHIVQKNDFLQSVKKDLKELKANCKADEQPQKISELFLKVNQNLRMSHELEEFQKNVDQVNREFFRKLQNRFSDLTDNEKRLSALLRLNLSSKEIATLNNISIKAVEMGRYRLRKKLRLDTNEILTDFLQNL